MPLPEMPHVPIPTRPPTLSVDAKMDVFFTPCNSTLPFPVPALLQMQRRPRVDGTLNFLLEALWVKSFHPFFSFSFCSSMSFSRWAFFSDRLRRRSRSAAHSACARRRGDEGRE